MCSMSVLCPLCAQMSFASIDALRVSLIKAANGPLICPICGDMFLGLDKLTIHLFSHTSIMSTAQVTTTTIKTSTVAAVSTSTTTTTTPSTELNTQVKDETMTASTMCASAEAMHLLGKEKTSQILKQLKPESLELQQNEQLLFTIKHATEPPSLSVTATAAATVDTMSFSTCDICEFTFRNEQLRDMHFRLVHQNISPTTSIGTTTETDVVAAINASYSKRYKRYNKVPDFKCHFCAKTFKMKGSLRVHLKVVHLLGLPYMNNSQKNNICDRIQSYRAMHTKVPNSTLVLDKQQQQEQEQPHFVIGTNSTEQLAPTKSSSQDEFPVRTLPLLSSTSNTAELNIAGTNCELISSTREHPLTITATNIAVPRPLPNLNSNILLVFNPTAPAESTGNNDIDSEFPIKTITSSNNISTSDNPKIWECDVCSKSFTTKYFLRKHKRLHTGEMPYTCEICARTFTFQQSYRKHLLYHSDEKPHVCNICGRAFKESSTLSNHVRIHSGEKPFKCEICGKSFRQRVSFLVHTRIHTGVMPYKCEICQKSFRYKVSQRTHKCLQKQSSLTDTRNISGDAIDHISESFMKAFLESTHVQLVCTESPYATDMLTDITTLSSNCSANENTKEISDEEALLSQSIDDIVVESCKRMGIGQNDTATPIPPIQNLSPSTNTTPTTAFKNDLIVQDGSSSPSQKMQNMCLYSPQIMDENDVEIDAVDDDFPRFHVPWTM